MLPKPGPVLDIDITRDRFKDHRLSYSFLAWFNAMLVRLLAAPSVLCRVISTALGAAIVTANLPTGQLDTGLYRVSWFNRCSRAGTVSSAATLTFTWTSGGVVCTFTDSALNGNTTASYKQGTLIVQADALTAITYAMSYASVGATSAQFDLGIFVESLQ